MSESNRSADERSGPRNLQGILTLAIENTIPGDGDVTERPDIQPLTDERRQFLQGALRAVSGPGPVDRIKTIVENLSEYCTRTAESSADASEEETDAVLGELEEMSEWCEDIDIACDFHKIGGFSLLPALQNNPNDELRWRCGDLIAAFCQNNPYCQQKLFEQTNQLDKLMEIIDCVKERPLVRVKALYALSGLLRGYEEGISRFAEKDGFSMLLRAMQSEDNSKLRTKATFLLMGIMRESDKYKRDLTNMGCVEQLITMLKSEHDSHHEHLMATLLELLSEFPPAVSEACRTEFNLHNFLKERLKLLQNRPEFKEEFDYAQRLVDVVFNDTTSISMDR